MRASALTALSYAFIATPYLLALLLGLVVPTLGVLCFTRFGAGLVVVVGMFAIEALYMFVGGISLGVSLYYTDIALVFVFAVGTLRLLSARERAPLQRAWWVFAAVVALSLVSGLANYGAAAGVQARPYFYFVAAALYGLSFRMDDRRVGASLNALAALAVLLIGITVFRWIVYYLPVPELLPAEGAYNNDGPIRVVRSHEALVLAQVWVVSLFFGRAAPGLRVLRALSPVLLALVLVLQHRSVWVATLAGVLTALATMLGGRRRRGSAVVQALIFAAIVGVTVVPMLASDQFSGVGAQITSSAGTALTTQGSAGERLDSWKEIVNHWAAGGARSILIGQSFGTDPSRFVRDPSGALRRIEYTAHNMYVQTLFNTGLVGLGAFLLAAGGVLRGLFRICAGAGSHAASHAAGNAAPPVTAQALLVLVVMQLVYYVPYGTDYLQSLIFAVAVSYVASQATRGAGAREAREAGEADEADLPRNAAGKNARRAPRWGTA